MRAVKSLLTITTTTAVVLGVTLLLPGDAQAQQVFSTLQSKASETFVNVRNILFLMGGFGVIGLAAMAYFGRFQFKWLFSLVGGLVLLAVTGSAIEYLTTQNGGGTVQHDASRFQDTLTTR